MFLGNLNEICLRHAENLKYALFLYLRTLFSWIKQRNLDNARGGILTAPSWHQKCKYLSNFRKWRISTTRNRIQPSNEQVFDILPRSCAKTTYCLQWCEALSSIFGFRGPFGLKSPVCKNLYLFNFFREPVWNMLETWRKFEGCIVSILSYYVFVEQIEKSGPC